MPFRQTCLGLTRRASSSGLILMLGLGSPVLANAQTINAPATLQRIITVTGQGEAKVDATEANINLTVEVEGKTADEVQSQVASRADAVVQFLRSQNVRNLQTTSINLNPNYSFNDGRRRLVGYRASNSVRFTVEANRSGRLIDQAVNAGATRVGGLSFNASDEAVDQARKQALKDATQNAQSQADAVLSELGLSEQEIIGIQVNGAIPRPVPVARQFAAAAESASSPVVAGEQTINASVTLQIRY